MATFIGLIMNSKCQQTLYEPHALDMDFFKFRISSIMLNGFNFA